MKYYFLSLFGVALLTFGGCKKTVTSTPIDNTVIYDNSFKIDGGVFKNATLNFKNVTTSSGAYSATGKNTFIEIMGTVDTLSLEYQIFVEGKKTGSFSLGSVADFMSINLGPTLDPTQTITLTSNSGGVIKITQYDAVGGKIKGTFGGTFNASGPDYTISNGTFSCVRADDRP